jgi:O-acetyl-ADP-ribose deacetylase (regulator of RNase III)
VRRSDGDARFAAAKLVRSAEIRSGRAGVRAAANDVAGPAGAAYESGMLPPWRARVAVVQGDLTRLDVDAIVNAANGSLLGGGGVDGAIHRAAGPGLLEECRALGGAATGEVKRTGGHRLRARHVLHAVGPVWRGGGAGEDEALARCYRNALRLAAEAGIRSVAFPAISTGAYGFPIDRATRIAVAEVRRALEAGSPVERVVFCCFSASDREEYEDALDEAAAG